MSTYVVRIALISLLALSACAKPPIETTDTSNPDIAVAPLFEKDGCKVYRFKDEIGRIGYYANCVNANATVSH